MTTKSEQVSEEMNDHDLGPIPVSSWQARVLLLKCNRALLFRATALVAGKSLLEPIGSLSEGMPPS